MRGRDKTPSTEYSIWLYSLDLKAQLHQLIRLGYLNSTLDGSLENYYTWQTD